jgi:hypothetical protein
MVDTGGHHETNPSSNLGRFTFMLIYLSYILSCAVVIDNQVLPRILHLLTEDQTNKIILKEACWTISNITAGTKEQVQVEMALDLYCYLLLVSQKHNLSLLF